MKWRCRFIDALLVLCVILPIVICVTGCCQEDPNQQAAVAQMDGKEVEIILVYEGEWMTSHRYRDGWLTLVKAHDNTRFHIAGCLGETGDRFIYKERFHGPVVTNIGG